MNHLLRITTLGTLCITCIWVLAEESTEPQPQTPQVQPAEATAHSAPQPYPGQRDPSKFPPPNNRSRQAPARYQSNRSDTVNSRHQTDSFKRKKEMNDAFIKHLRKEDPAEADRLQQLQETDKRGFIEAIKLRLNERKLELALQHYPNVLSEIQNLSRAERAEVTQIIMSLTSEPKKPKGRKNFRPERQPGISGTDSKGSGDPRPQGDTQRDETTQKLARAYQANPDPANRERLNKKIQSQLEEIFDTREAFQEKQVASIEATLKQLKERIETRKSHRAEIIEKRRQELTGSSDLSW